ncbi:hypothetical protein NCC49_005283 [Naganishia albida]|nr:hypothetical protein NCC49_005283 [Naganishia albida]
MLLDANDKELLDFFAEKIGTATAIVIKYDHKTSPAQKVFMQIFLSRMPAESIEKYNAAFEREKTTDRSHMPARGGGSLTSAARSLASSGTTALSIVATFVGLSTNTSPNTADQSPLQLRELREGMLTGGSEAPTADGSSTGDPALTGEK